MDSIEKMAMKGHFPSFFILLKREEKNLSGVIPVVKECILSSRKRNLPEKRIKYLIDSFVAYEKRGAFFKKLTFTEPRDFLDDLEKGNQVPKCKVCTKDATRISYEVQGTKINFVCSLCIENPAVETLPQEIKPEDPQEIITEPSTEEKINDPQIQVGQLWEQDGQQFEIEEISDKITLKPILKGRRRKLLLESLLERYQKVN